MSYWKNFLTVKFLSKAHMFQEEEVVQGGSLLPVLLKGQMFLDVKIYVDGSHGATSSAMFEDLF